MKLRRLSLVMGALAGLVLVGCEGDDGSASQDGRARDAAAPHPDAELDAAQPVDAAVADAGRDDGASGDAGSVNDAGDAAVEDAGDGSAPAIPRWYEPTSAVALDLSGALGEAFSAAFAGTPDGIIPPDRKKEPFAGSVVYPYLDRSSHTHAVELAVRGNSSLQECAFPKLKLAFEARSDQPNDLFYDTRKLKIGTHCGEEETVNGTIGRLRNELATWREEVVYQLARAMGITIMQTRPATVRYSDSSAVKAFEGTLVRKAFLLEHVDELARRLGATALKDPVDCGPDSSARPDHQAVLRVKLFHALIGNWDWQLGPPETDGCGDLVNTEVLVHADGSLTLVPADFDLAAFVVGRVRNPDNNRLEVVTADNAKASARHYLQISSQGETSSALGAIEAEYLSKGDQLRGLIDASLMDEEGKRAGKLLLDGFLAVLAE